MTVFHEVVNMVSATAAGTDNETAATEKTLPEDCRMIRRIWVDAVPVGTAAAAKPFLGYIKVDSEDIDGLAPCHLPCEPQSAFLGTGGGTLAREPHRWVINRPTKAGPTVKFVSVVDIAPNGAAELFITIEYSTGEPYPGNPIGINYKIAKSATTGPVANTSDNGTDAGPDISLKGAKKIIAAFAYAAPTSLTADEAMALEGAVTSDDFVHAGPHKFGINGASVIDATNAIQPVHGGVTIIEGDIAIKTENPTVSCTVTSRDGTTTGATWNWGLIYV